MALSLSHRLLGSGGASYLTLTRACGLDREILLRCLAIVAPPDASPVFCFEKHKKSENCAKMPPCIFSRDCQTKVHRTSEREVLEFLREQVWLPAGGAQNFAPAEQTRQHAPEEVKQRKGITL